MHLLSLYSNALTFTLFHILMHLLSLNFVLVFVEGCGKISHYFEDSVKEHQDSDNKATEIRVRILYFVGYKVSHSEPRHPLSVRRKVREGNRALLRSRESRRLLLMLLHQSMHSYNLVVPKEIVDSSSLPKYLVPSTNNVQIDVQYSAVAIYLS